MAKYEFVIETNPVTKAVRYWTEKDGYYVDWSISDCKETAYNRFMNACSGVDLNSKKDVLETVYTLTD